MISPMMCGCVNGVEEGLLILIVGVDVAVVSCLSCSSGEKGSFVRRMQGSDHPVEGNAFRSCLYA